MSKLYAIAPGQKVNDALCVTGDLGGAFAGLKILLREKKFWVENGAGREFQPGAG